MENSISPINQLVIRSAKDFSDKKKARAFEILARTSGYDAFSAACFPHREEVLGGVLKEMPELPDEQADEWAFEFMRRYDCYLMALWILSEPLIGPNGAPRSYWRELHKELQAIYRRKVEEGILRDFSDF